LKYCRWFKLSKGHAKSGKIYFAELHVCTKLIEVLIMVLLMYVIVITRPTTYMEWVQKQKL